MADLAALRREIEGERASVRMAVKYNDDKTAAKHLIRVGVLERKIRRALRKQAGS